MRKHYATIFAILFLAFNYSCKQEEISIKKESNKGPNISAVKVNGKLFIQKETNGRTELLDKLVTEDFIAIPFIDDKNLLAIKVSPKDQPHSKNALLSGWFFTLDGSKYICDDVAWNECKHLEKLNFGFYRDDCTLLWHSNGHTWNITTHPVYWTASWTEERDYLQCWKENDPTGVVD